MGVYIKGMEMPKNCGFCPFCRKTVTEWGSIYSADCIIRKMPIKFSELDLRDGLCPLIELPPHGDLIDRDKLETHHGWYNEDRERNVVQTHIQFVYANDILTAPIVVESEE